MREILLTSSVLILALLALRLAFRGRISRRAQYALWALVLLRLLAPVSLPGADFSVLSAAEPVGQAVAERLETPLIPAPDREAAPPVTVLPDVTESAPAESPEAALPAGGAGAEAAAPDTSAGRTAGPARTLTAVEVLTAVWLAGAAAMAVWFLASNLRFWRKLRKARTPYTADGCAYPVYLVEEGLPSPCLFGLVRPAVYLTPAALETPERLRHVIAHETAHARHWDPLWSLLRSVCLAVYWFNPLVWIAAYVSKADGELACDEAAIRSLGEAERIPYGRTLLALIPVRRGPGSPLLSATTMTAGRRQLTERITRIAKGSQTRAAALFLALTLAAGLCAVTFTGAKGDASPDGGASRPLTGDELAYFNEEFFNNDTVDNVVGLNIHNQFLTSLYERPEDIDLFELFYCGTGLSGSMSDEELRLVYGDTLPDCARYKATSADMDGILEEYMGLTVAETSGVGLENFTYLPDYDAYYWAHGDTNYFHSVQVTAGERVGNTIRLYYPDTSARYDSAWLCVTLEAQDDGSYWFVSNQPSEQPAIPTVYPEGDPVLTIPLTDREPYEPEAVEVTRHTGDCAERGGGYGVDSEDGDELHVRTYLSTDGNLYAAVIYDEAAGRDGMLTWDVGCFFTFPEQNSIEYGEASISCSFFHDLFGHDGLVIRYSGDLDEHTSVTFHDYYYFDSNRDPVLLARVHGSEPAILDLDGDGTNELLSDGGQLVFQRDGQLYEADLKDLLAENWPEMDWWDHGAIDVSRRCLTVRGTVRGADGGTFYSFTRYLYFDGENILVYRDSRTTEDHVMEGAEAPEDVMAVLRDYVLEQYEASENGYRLVDGEFVPAPVEFDDWRIESIEGPFYVSVGGLDFAIWSMNYEIHTTTPESVSLAGGRYITEDCWVSPGYPGCDYFYFQLDGDGNRAYLYHRMENDCSPGTEAFFSDMAYQLRGMGLLSFRDLTGRELLDMCVGQPVSFFNNLAEGSLSERSQALAAMAACVAAGDDPGAQETYDSIVHYMEVFLEDLTVGGLAAWQTFQSALSSWTAAGDGAVYESGGLTLWVPEGWADMAVITAGDSVWAGGSVPGFDVYERLAHEADPSTGLVWNVRALTRAQFRSAFGDADWSEILGASSYVIGSDDAYIYLLSTPTDVQFLLDAPGDLSSCVNYETLRLQSQTVIEDFLFRNGVTPNPNCPDADGCYRYVGSTPTELDIREALLDDYYKVDPPPHDPDARTYQTEAHRILAREGGGDTYTYYLIAWRCTFELRDGAYDFTRGDRIPTALTFTLEDGDWRLTEYWIPGDGEAYARDLLAKFPPEAAEQELDSETCGAISDELMEQCYAQAEAYFAQHPVSASLLQSSSAPSEEDLHAAILDYQSGSLPMDSDGCAEAHQVLKETSGQDTHTFHLFVYCTSFLEEDGSLVQDWYSLFPAAITFRYENGSWQPAGSWGFYGSDTFDRPDLFPGFPTETLELYMKDGVQTERFRELYAELRAECLQSAEAESA